MRTSAMNQALPTILGVALLTVVGACAGGAAPQLGPAATPAESGASNPTTAIDARTGTTYVAWVAANGDGVSNVYLARSDDGATYSEPVRVNDVAGDAAPHEQAPAQVAVGPEGNVYLVWQNRTPVDWLDFGAADVRFARSTDGGRTFEPSITVNDDAGGVPARHTFHDIAVAADGTVYISWIDARDRDRYRRDAARATAPDQAAGTGAPAGEAGTDGQADGAQGGVEPGTDIRVARSTDGGRTFGPGVVVDTDNCPCCRTSLAVAPDGTVYVAWRKIYEGNVRDIVVARSADGGRSFAVPVRVHEDGWVFPGCPHAGPSLAVDGDGRVHVAWYTGRTAGPGIYYAVSANAGERFGEPAGLLTGEWVPVSQVKLAAAGDGTIWIAWDDRRAEEEQVRFARADRTGRLEPLDVGPVQGASPAIAADADVRALAWLDGEAVRIRVGSE